MVAYKIRQNDDRTYPMGLTVLEHGIHVEAALEGEPCSLVLFSPGRDRPLGRIPFPSQNRRGDVWSMTLEGDFQGLEYCFEAGGEMVPDPYAKSLSGREAWGDLKSASRLMRARVMQEDFDWEGDVPLQIPYEECVVYRIHVRGFTRHASSKCQDRGTFKAVMEKIPYLKDLGITTLELMPVTDFQEVIVPKGVGGNPFGPEQPTGKLNYWGYADSFRMAPKSSFASASGKALKGEWRHEPVREFKELVKELHQAGIEVVVELYFTGEESPTFVLDTLRFWVREYHVDGIHLTGFAHVGLIQGDAYLSRSKLWADSWADGGGAHRNLAEYNDGFMTDMRKVLKGDEDQMNQLVFRTKHNPKDFACINYMANTNGFTMMDLMSYEMKHNEANGENNQDGCSYNYSWNCGVEGPTRKKKLVELRRKQIRNAWLLLFLSQGTPLILSGDEFGNTQGGNNNAYCQDNEVSWLNWNQLQGNRAIYEFVRYLIAFRKSHPVFHKAKEPRAMDYLACGQPDVSYHGVRAWCPEFDNFRRQLGILYCGEYERREDDRPDDYFYVAYNMHWEPHEFALPNLPGGLKWHIAVDTDAKQVNGYYLPGEEPLLEEQKRMPIPARTIMVFIGK